MAHALLEDKDNLNITPDEKRLLELIDTEEKAFQGLQTDVTAKLKMTYSWLDSGEPIDISDDEEFQTEMTFEIKRLQNKEKRLDAEEENLQRLRTSLSNNEKCTEREYKRLMLENWDMVKEDLQHLTIGERRREVNRMWQSFAKNARDQRVLQSDCLNLLRVRILKLIIEKRVAKAKLLQELEAARKAKNCKREHNLYFCENCKRIFNKKLQKRFKKRNIYITHAKNENDVWNI